MKGDPQNLKSPEHGDNILLFMDKFDPPTLDHARAIDALFTYGKWVWLCPIDTNKNACDMANIITVDMRANNKNVDFCSAAVDKKINVEDFLSWIRKKYPDQNFIVASLNGQYFEVKRQWISVVVGEKSGQVKPGGIVLSVEKFLPSPTDIQKRIISGSDESRHFIRPVWDYLQRHRLYRS